MIVPVLFYIRKDKQTDTAQKPKIKNNTQEVYEMNEIKKNLVNMSDEALEAVAGGASADYLAALDVMQGKYGDGEDRKRRLTAAGYSYQSVQHLVNALAKGYGPVAADVINGRYGNNQARIYALRAAGYDPALVQDLVNAMLK